jgi:hypothetical protein
MTGSSPSWRVEPPAPKPDRSPDRRRAAAAARQRRHAARARRGIATAVVEYDWKVLDTLVGLGYVREDEAADRAAVGAGIAAALKSLTHNQ